MTQFCYEIKRPQANASMAIGQLAERTNCNVPTIRYYEEIGLLPTARRSSNGHRKYDESTVELLTFIRHCRDFGFSIECIKELVSLSQNGQQACGSVRDVVQERLEMVSAKLIELQALEQRLKLFVKSCSDLCSEGPAPQCSILKDIISPSPDVADKNRGCCG